MLPVSQQENANEKPMSRKKAVGLPQCSVQLVDVWGLTERVFVRCLQVNWGEYEAYQQYQDHQVRDVLHELVQAASTAIESQPGIDSGFLPESEATALEPAHGRDVAGETSSHEEHAATQSSSSVETEDRSTDRRSHDSNSDDRRSHEYDDGGSGSFDRHGEKCGCASAGEEERGPGSARDVNGSQRGGYSVDGGEAGPDEEYGNGGCSELTRMDEIDAAGVLSSLTTQPASGLLRREGDGGLLGVDGGDRMDTSSGSQSGSDDEGDSEGESTSDGDAKSSEDERRSDGDGGHRCQNGRTAADGKEVTGFGRCVSNSF